MKALTEILRYVLIICNLLIGLNLVSCEKSEPPSYEENEDSIFITFSGDTYDFKGYVTAELASGNGVLTSSSFTTNKINYYSAKDFNKSYDLKLKYIVGNDPKVKITLTALCISDNPLVLKINVYKLNYNGSYILKEDVEIPSYKDSSVLSSKDYTVEIEI